MHIHALLFTLKSLREAAVSRAPPPNPLGRGERGGWGEQRPDARGGDKDRLQERSEYRHMPQGAFVKFRAYLTI